MSRLPAAQRREQLLDRALTLFSEHGYARATTAQLAKAAGVTEPIIYRHFASKKDLFIALIRRTGERTLALWEKDLTNAPDPAERLRLLIEDNPMVSEDGKEEYRVFLQAITEVDDPQIREALRDHIVGLHSFLTRELRTAQSEQKVGPRFTPELIAWLLINIGMGYGVLSAMQIGGHGRDEAGVHVVDAIKTLLVG